MGSSCTGDASFLADVTGMEWEGVEVGSMCCTGFPSNFSCVVLVTETRRCLFMPFREDFLGISYSSTIVTC